MPVVTANNIWKSFLNTVEALETKKAVKRVSLMFQKRFPGTVSSKRR